MAIKTDNIVDPQQLKTQIGLALANGGVYAVQTTKDIYITEVTENVSRQMVTNIVNVPSGQLGGELQFTNGRGFASTANLRYTDDMGLYLRGNMAMTGNINLTGSLVSTGVLNLGSPTMVKITGGNAGDVLFTDGAGNLGWVTAAGATYGNGNVAAYLPTNTANISAGNASLGNLAVSNFYTGTLTTALQPNITQVGTLTTLAVTGAVSTGSLSTTGTITATGNIQGSNISTAGNIFGLNLTINNILSLGNLAVNGNITSARVDATHYGDGGNLTNLNGASVVGDVAGSNHSNVADVANLVAGANVIGTVANAFYADSSTTALTVPASGVVGIVANSSFATLAATANSVVGANITGTVASATIAATANAVAGSNVSGEVAFAAVANLVAGSNVAGEVAFAAVANLVAGSNVAGQVSSALNSDYAGNITISTQPNITSVGTLTALSVSGTTSLGPVGNVWITGGNAGQILTTDGAGHLSWSTPSITKTTPVPFSSLPTAASAGMGARSFITDSIVNAFGSTVLTGGGSFRVPVFSNGSSWLVG
jgi:hypothetical protein